MTLLVVGGGPLEARLRRVAAEVAPGRVTFTGVLADVRDAYRAADVAVLTSETEGLPGVLVEAALSGLPVVATDVGFVRDVVPDGTGLLVPVGDAKATAAAISRCIAEPTWGVTARDRCERTFDLVSAVDRWLALLHQVCVHRH